MRRYRAFRQKFDKLDPTMRDAYLLKVFSSGDDKENAETEGKSANEDC